MAGNRKTFTSLLPSSVNPWFLEKPFSPHPRICWNQNHGSYKSLIETLLRLIPDLENDHYHFQTFFSDTIKLSARGFFQENIYKSSLPFSFFISG